MSGFQSLILLFAALVISLLVLVDCLPGHQALGVDHLEKDLPTPTSAPRFVPSKRKADVLSFTCDSTVCSVFDVTASFLGTFNPALFTATTSITPSSCQGTGCSTSIPLLTTGVSTGTGLPGPISTNSRGPFANGTDTAQPTVGPTASGTISISGTGISPSPNSTTYVYSTLTLSVTTYTAPFPWSAWTSGPVTAGTGASSGIPTSCTEDATWSNSTSSTGSDDAISTLAEASPSSTTDAAATSQVQESESRSFVSTATFVFAETTNYVPIPDTFPSTFPDVAGPETTPSTTATDSDEPSVSTYGSTSCFSTTNTVTSGTASAVIAEADVVCYGIWCEDGVCTDFLTRSALYTSTVGAPSPTGTGGAVVSASPSFSFEAGRQSISTNSSDIVSPTATSTSSETSETYIPWAAWTATLSTITSSSSSSNGAVSTSTSSSSPSTSIGPAVNPDELEDSDDDDEGESDDDVDPNDDRKIRGRSLHTKHRRAAVKAKRHEANQEKLKPSNTRPEQKFDGLLQKKRIESAKLDTMQAGSSGSSCCSGALHCWIVGGTRC
ncbi:hypothetical protein LTR64_004880 [Lithohypha guttulata]|uniref:uncharacterized protein n=1 Tax=Lithohypha guttulata TaxID=1690604 RepID=UPI002DDE3B7F|nr:hypothetical protein LTR51_005283 [Lithohypha guttulata]